MVPVRNNWSVFTTLDNLFNRRYEVVPGYLMPGVNAAGGITVSFKNGSRAPSLRPMVISAVMAALRWCSPPLSTWWGWAASFCRCCAAR
jgi:hypothetical protein